MDEMKEELLDRIMLVLIQSGASDPQLCRMQILKILGNYDVTRGERALTVYTEGKNEFYLKKFILAKAVAGCSKSTLYQYSNTIRRALAEIGKDADTITHEDVQLLLAKIMQRSSKAHADNVRRNLSSFYTYLMREELVLKNPMYRVDKIKTQKKEKQAFTDYDVERIRNACRTMREKAIVEVLLSTGCRVGELISIRTEDLQEGIQPMISILGKGGKYRNVYLTARADIAVHAYLNERKDTNPYLFPKGSVKIGERSKNADMLRHMRDEWYKNPALVSQTGACDKGVIEGIIRKIGKKASVEDCYPHRFRRTCATFALRRGMPIEQVSRMLGHAEIATTQIYLDMTEEELAQAHKKYVV